MPSNGLSWSFSQIWNESLEQRENRPYKARETIWASELGGAMIDRYLKFTGVEPSNPFSPRSLRKFEAGNIWEWIVRLVLKRAGIHLEDQGWVKYQYPHCLAVTGKFDDYAGGKPDWEKSKAEIHALELPEIIDRAVNNIIAHFQEKYPDGLKKIVLETKSLSSFMFEVYLRLGTGDIRHKMQAFHYLKAKDLDEAHIVYVSKDDCRLLEIGVMNPSPIEDQYKKDIETFSKYVFGKTKPSKEPEIVFQPDLFKFSQNYKVGYSQYLTMLYDYKDQAEFEAKYRPMATRWTRVLNRFINDEKITDNNLEVVRKIKSAGFDNFENLIIQGKKLKAKGLIESEVEDGQIE